MFLDVPVMAVVTLRVSLPDDSDTPMLPSSLMLLNTAHEYLGRRSLCCSSDGALLKFYVSLWDSFLKHFEGAICTIRALFLFKTFEKLLNSINRLKGSGVGMPTS